MSVLHLCLEFLAAAGCTLAQALVRTGEGKRNLLVAVIKH